MYIKFGKVIWKWDVCKAQTLSENIFADLRCYK